MSLSLRLTLWYTAIAGLMVVAASAIVYLAVAGNLQADLDDSLATEARGLARAIVVEGGPMRPLRLVLPRLGPFPGGSGPRGVPGGGPAGKTPRAGGGAAQRGGKMAGGDLRGTPAPRRDRVRARGAKRPRASHRSSPTS